MQLFTMCNCQGGKDSLWRREDGSEALVGEAGLVQEARGGEAGGEDAGERRVSNYQVRQVSRLTVGVGRGL